MVQPPQIKICSVPPPPLPTRLLIPALHRDRGTYKTTRWPYSLQAFLQCSGWSACLVFGGIIDSNLFAETQDYFFLSQVNDVTVI